MDWNRLLCVRWDNESRPLPIREVKAIRSRGPTVHAPVQPWHDSGPLATPLDFSLKVRVLLTDIVARCPELGYVQINKVMIGFTQARGSRSHGLQARVTPLRFPNGQVTRTRGGVTYQVQRFFLDHHEFLYLMTFCLPRFLDQSFDDKFITLFHELYHMHPEFNGDLRRHAGRCHLHTHSQSSYDRGMADLARAYLADKPDPSLHSFLRFDFAQLRARHGAVTGIIVPRPKLIPLPTPLPSAARS